MPVLTKNTTDLVLGARQKSNTVFNQVVKDDEIVNRLSEALSELDGFLTASNEHYRFSTTAFTLQNGMPNDGLNIADLPDDFYKELSLDRKNTGGNFNETVTRFNIMERNRMTNRRFEILGGKIQVNPSQIAGGDYVFRYIATPPILLIPSAITVKTTSTADSVSAGRSFAINTGSDLILGEPANQWDLNNAAFAQADVGAILSVSGQVSPRNNGLFTILTVFNPVLAGTDGFMLSASPLAAGTVKISSVPDVSSATWTFQNFTFDQSYVGMDLIVSGCTNPGNNGIFPITEVVGQHVVRTISGQNISESFDGLVSVSVQQPGSIWRLPQIYMPWFEYLECRAARDILQKREQSTDEMDARIAMLIQRIQSLAAIRTEDGGQVPLADNWNDGWFNSDWLGFSN